MYRSTCTQEKLLKKPVKNLPYIIKSLGTAILPTGVAAVIALVIFIPQVSCASKWQQGLQQFDSVLPLSRLRFKSRSYSSSRINPTAIINSPLKRTFAISLGIDSKSGQGLQRFGFVLPTSLALANKEGKNKLEMRCSSRDPIQTMIPSLKRRGKSR